MRHPSVLPSGRTPPRAGARRAPAAVLLLTLAARAGADLPTVPAPKGFANNDWLTLIKGYIRDGGVTLGLALSVIAFLWVSYCAISKFNEARNGRAEWAEVGLLAVVAAGVLLFVGYLLNEAAKVIA